MEDMLDKVLSLLERKDGGEYNNEEETHAGKHSKTSQSPASKSTAAIAEQAKEAEQQKAMEENSVEMARVKQEIAKLTAQLQHAAQPMMPHQQQTLQQDQQGNPNQQQMHQLYQYNPPYPQAGMYPGAPPYQQQQHNMMGEPYRLYNQTGSPTNRYAHDAQMQSPQADNTGAVAFADGRKAAANLKDKFDDVDSVPKGNGNP